jgi:hypothetical protein
MRVTLIKASRNRYHFKVLASSPLLGLNRSCTGLFKQNLKMKSITVPSHEREIQASRVSQPFWSRVVLLFVLGYEAAGSMLGGVLLVASPDGKFMDMPVGIMHGAFKDFLVPGIILLGLGLLNAFAFALVLKKTKSDWFLAGLALGGMLIWFIVEIIILRELHWLHLMWGMPVLWGWVMVIPLIASRNATAAMQNVLLICGIFSSLWYAAINFYVPMHYEGYVIAAYTPSELSAINAPTRVLWVLLCLPYSLAFAVFGWGVLQVKDHDRNLRLVGSLIIAYCIFGFYWPPMHMRGNEATLTDTLHIAWAVVTNIFMWLFMGFGAAALSRRFRIYTISSIALHLVFGALTFAEAPNIAINGPTPTIGIWERINIGIFMLWVIVFAVALMKKNKTVIAEAGKK